MKILNSLLLVIVMAITVSAQEVVRKNIHSNKMNKDVKTIIIVPKLQKEKKYKTVYILHGFSASPERAYEHDIPNLEKLAEKYQTIYILPDGNYSSWYVDSPIDSKSQYETFIGEELVHYIDENYPTEGNKNSRGILGWSMGGYGALSIGLAKHETFSAVGSVCGALDFNRFGASYHNYQVDSVLGDLKKLPSQYFTFNKIGQMKANAQYYIIDCGTEDSEMIEMNRDFHQRLTKEKVEHLYIESPGVHNPDYWRKALVNQLALFNEHFDKL
ncbi:alpha/beta hydrolase [Chishuiella changwenlii]|uniref:alpha/beta hydrolase n=1 Tax=Chishuiella changwenlii TaxID=1434701 RepID=UPI002FDB6667